MPPLVYNTIPIQYHLAPRVTQNTFDSIQIECNIELTDKEISFKIYDTNCIDKVLIEKTIANGGISIVDFQGTAVIEPFFLELKPGVYPYNITFTDLLNDRVTTYLKGTVAVLSNI